MIHVLLDEIQLVDEYEKVVNSLFSKENVDAYITGSNAKMLSSEIATLLSGRYVEIQILPLSFHEYESGISVDKDQLALYQDYLEYSSFPYAINLENDPMLVKDCLDGILNTVLLKDVVANKNIADVMMLESLVAYLFDNIGNLTSIKNC